MDVSLTKGNTFSELHWYRKHKFYSGKDFELIVFSDYRYGKPSVLLKYKQYNKFNGVFVELYGGHSSSSGDKSTYSLNNVWEEYGQKVNIWTMSGKAFVSVGSTNFEILEEFSEFAIGRSEVLQLPNRRIMKFFYKFKDTNDYLIVDADELHHNLDSRMYIGNNVNGYEEIDILVTESYRDGGTTNVTTSLGDLYVPTRFKKDLVATWTYNDGGNKKHKLEKVEVDITNEYEVKMVHEILNIKQDRILKNE